MSQNLLVEIKNNEELIDWGVYKWGGFRETSLNLTKLIINNIDCNKEYKKVLEKAGTEYGYDKANMFISDENEELYNISIIIHINIETKTLDYGLHAYDVKDDKHFKIDSEKLHIYDIEVLNIPFSEFDNFIYKLNLIEDDYYIIKSYPDRFIDNTDRFIDNIEGM